jgi:hypothetical protein
MKVAPAVSMLFPFLIKKGSIKSMESFRADRFMFMYKFETLINPH